MRALILVLVTIGALRSVHGRDEPAFELSFEGCPAAIDGQPGDVQTFEVTATLTISGSDGQGVNGWAIAVFASTFNARVAEVSLEGMRVPVLRDDDGDPATPPVPGEMDLLDAFEASTGFLESAPQIALTSVRLDAAGRVTLPPEGRFGLARITVEAMVPGARQCSPLELNFAVYDDAGGLVENRVFRLGEEVPVRYSDSCLVPYPACTPELTYSVVPPGRDPPADGDLLVERTVAAGEYVFPIDVLLTSSFGLPEKEGPQGWSLGLEHGAECMSLDDATVKGVHVQTIYDHDGDPSTPDLDPYDLDLASSGFNRVMESRGGPGTDLPDGVRGVVSVIVLDQIRKMVLHMNATDPILRLRYRVAVPAGGTVECRLKFTDGMKGAGGPISNVATVFGGSSKPRTHGLVLRLTAGEPPFRIGDANADGRVDLSDAIFILDNLFLGGPRPSCRKTGDLDDNGSPEITDPIFLLSHLFLGGPPPVEPGVCRPDRTPDALGCISYPPCE